MPIRASQLCDTDNARGRVSINIGGSVREPFMSLSETTGSTPLDRDWSL